MELFKTVFSRLIITSPDAGDKLQMGYKGIMQTDQSVTFISSFKNRIGIISNI